MRAALTAWPPMSSSLDLSASAADSLIDPLTSVDGDALAPSADTLRALDLTERPRDCDGRTRRSWYRF